MNEKSFELANKRLVLRISEKEKEIKELRNTIKELELRLSDRVKVNPTTREKIIAERHSKIEELLESRSILNSFELEFLLSIKMKRTLSVKQQAWVDSLYQDKINKEQCL